MILGIESSCDESAVALFSEEKGMIGEWVHSQLDLHQEYGGVVPALASREHLKRFGPILKKVHEHEESNEIDKIAVTYGPGLAGCLALGIALGKALSVALEMPLVGVNHLHGHVYSPFINLHKENPEGFMGRFERLLPHLGLIVSGGNTTLFKIGVDKKLKLLAQTVDDAAGEALDKGAKLLGMPYPGGALIEKVAQRGNARAIDFPKAFPSSEDMKFSFSGLKTSLRYRLEKMSDTELERTLPNICASYQEAVVQAIIKKTKQALAKGTYASMGLSGGVANNKRLRTLFASVSESKKLPYYIAEPKHTGDNAAMIAFAAYVGGQSVVANEHHSLSFDPSLPLA